MQIRRNGLRLRAQKGMARGRLKKRPRRVPRRRPRRGLPRRNAFESQATRRFGPELISSRNEGIASILRGTQVLTGWKQNGNSCQKHLRDKRAALSQVLEEVAQASRLRSSWDHNRDGCATFRRTDSFPLTDRLNTRHTRLHFFHEAINGERFRNKPAHSRLL
jgi:hypothetical protein